jgi:hypothetical protein
VHCVVQLAEETQRAPLLPDLLRRQFRPRLGLTPRAAQIVTAGSRKNEKKQYEQIGIPE